MERNKLCNPQYRNLVAGEREAALLSLSEFDKRFTFLRFEYFEGCEITTDTAVYSCNGKEFVFVPGDIVTLGWDSFSEGMDEQTQEKMAEALAEFEITDLAAYINDNTSELRQAAIAPMLVEREVNMIGWRELPSDSPELAAFRQDIEKYQRHFASHSVFEIHKTLRMRQVDGRLITELYAPISLNELICNTHAAGFALPTEDEWEYLCACGKRTLFRWGDSFDFDMKLYHFDRHQLNDSPYSLKLPNGFGLSIAYDPYMQEVVENSEYFLKGGDGGCNICGGSGMVLGYLPVSAFFRSESLSSDSLDSQDDIGGDYTFYRRIVRLT
ncbi:hypothetical protein ACYULU_03240 [Breznakiellaceae bacterium SP9]